MTGSKSKTSIASFGSAISRSGSRRTQIIGSDERAISAIAPRAKSGLAATNWIMPWSMRRRLATAFGCIASSSPMQQDACCDSAPYAGLHASIAEARSAMQPPFTTRPEIRGTFGAIASTHWLATQTGMAVLERGGNAFDAAVAAGFVLQIVEPHLNGPGGELPALVLRAGARAPDVICGQGPFPAAATVARGAALGLRQMPGTGLLPAVVPGAFDGWMLLLRDYGTLTLREILQYAIHYAEHGFPLVPRIVATIIPAVDYFQTEWKSSGEVWLANGKAPHPDKPFRTPAIAATYRRILAEAESAGGERERQIEAARHAYYKGFVAEAIDRFFRTALMDS